MWLIIIICLASLSGIYIVYLGKDLEAWVVGGFAGGCLALVLALIGTYLFDYENNFLESFKNDALLKSYNRHSGFYGLGYYCLIIATIVRIGKFTKVR